MWVKAMLSEFNESKFSAFEPGIALSRIDDSFNSRATIYSVMISRVNDSQFVLISRF